MNQRIELAFSVITQLETVVDIDQLKTVITDITHGAGFDFFACSVIRPTSLSRPNVTIISNVPSDWLERYSTGSFVSIDPVVDTARTQMHPIFWQKIRAPDEQMCVMDAAYNMGLRDGISFPLRGPNGERGALSFIRDAVGFADEQYVTIGLIAPYVMSAIVRCSQQMSDVTLSLSEQRCLYWAAAGKTTEEIGVITGILPRTVTYHIKRAGIKLGATNRDQAIANAALLNLIRPEQF